MTMTQEITCAARRLRGTPETIAATLAALLEDYPREPGGEVSLRDRRQHREATAAHWLKVYAHRHWLTLEFARRQGWKFRREDHFTYAMLADGRKRRRPTDNDWCGWSDHDHFFRDLDGNPAAVAGHPYDLDRVGAQAGYAASATHCGLKATFPTDFPSWWYPGRTGIVLFTPATAGTARGMAA